MAFLRQKKDFKYVCFYLSHGPGKFDPTWSAARRQFLVNSKWGFLPTYVGSQVESPPRGKGIEHGKEAVRRLSLAGFPKGTIVYLDIETPKPKGGAFENYIKEWMKVIRDQGFYPGVYGSYLMAPWLVQLTSAVWTVELPFSRTQLLGTLESMNAPQGATPETYLQMLYEQSFLSYDPRKNPTGIIDPVASQLNICGTFDILTYHWTTE